MSNVWSSAKIVEADFSGIEAVLLGWFMRRKEYIRLAKLGMHAYVASHVLGRPADLSWPDADLAKYFKQIKGAEDTETVLAYNRCKRVVHGKGYGMTVHGVLRNNPQYFRTLKEAEAIDKVYCDIAPGLPELHTVLRHTAHEQHFLGGADAYVYDPANLKASGHPYGYMHWFWSVVSYRRLNAAQVLWHKKRKVPMMEWNGIAYAVQLGEDAKRCVAFLPQSTARGILTDACLALFDPEHELADRCYIGDFYYGDTPLRAPIHDSLLLECPTRKVDQLLERVAYAMQRPVEALPCPAEWGMGPYLTIGVDAKMGPSWGEMAKVTLPSLQDLGVANDTVFTPAEEGEEEDVAELEMEVA